MVVLTSLIQSWYNKNVARLTTQGCNNIVISWLYRTCWNDLATSLIISTSLLQLLITGCFKLVDNLGQAVRTQLVHGLATRCEIFACVLQNTNNVHTRSTVHAHVKVVTDLQSSCNKVVVKPISGCVPDLSLQQGTSSANTSCWQAVGSQRVTGRTLTFRLDTSA
jgi:hypothetical protein